MRYRKLTACAGFAVLVLGVSLAAAQTEGRRQFDVPYVSSTEQAVPGTWVVSNTFDMRDWKPEKEQSLPGADDDEAAYLSHKFFLWTIPSRREVTK
jgi:hypothetical protein